MATSTLLSKIATDIVGTPVISRLTRAAESALNPLIGKSFVAYATKPRDAASLAQELG